MRSGTRNSGSRIQNAHRGGSAFRTLWAFCILYSAFCVLPSPGCHSANHDPNAGMRATHVDPETAKFSYWINQPPVASVVCDDFETLWHACRRATEGAS